MKKFLFLLIIFTCSFMITSKNVYATNVDEIVIYQPFEEPVDSETSGYVTLLFRHVPSGNYVTKNVSWSFIVDPSSHDTPFANLTVYDYNFKIDFYGFNSSIIAIDEWWSTPGVLYDYMEPRSYTDYFQEDSYTYYYGNSGYQIVGFQQKGITEIVNGTTTYKSFTNIWGGSNCLQSHLLGVISETLLGMSAEDKLLYNKVFSILQNSNETLTILNQLLDITEVYIPDLYVLLDTYIKSIDSELNEVDANLETIITILENFVLDEEAGQGEEVDKSSTQSQKDKESALLNKGSPTSNTSSVKVQLDSTANGTIWSIAESFINSNALIMGFFISMLSLGVVRLILNR